MRALAACWLGAMALCASCFFDLADVVEPGSGGAGAGGAGSGANDGSSGWQIVIDYQAMATVAALADFPVLVTLSPSDIDYAEAAADGSDVRFFDGDGTTPLAHEIELWNPNGASVLWVKLPKLSAKGGSFQMRYGLAGAPPALGNVWMAFEGVYHLVEDPADDSFVRDSANQHNGVAMGAFSVTGRIGRALDFGGSDRIAVGGDTGFDVNPGEGRTVSAWVQRSTTMIAPMTVVRTKNSCCDGWALRLLGDQFANVRMDATTGSCCAGGDQGATSPPHCYPGGAGGTEWVHLTVVMDRANDQIAAYIDGVEVETGGFSLGDVMNGNDFVIGIDEYDANGFIGAIDEVRIGSSAFSKDWIGATYRSDTGALLSYGSPTLLP